MKIIDNALKSYSINDLGEGATFKYNNDYYIKMSQELRDGFGPFNAVRLTDGHPALIIEVSEVIPFNCELIVL